MSKITANDDELNVMILNEVDIGISKIELDKSDLLITDKSCKYCLKVCVQYNWKEINDLKVGEKKSIDFNEYCLSENNEPALILPSNCYVEKIDSNLISFYLKFGDLNNSIHYMNQRRHFDIKLYSLEAKVLIDYKDVNGNSIIYEF